MFKKVLIMLFCCLSTIFIFSINAKAEEAVNAIYIDKGSYVVEATVDSKWDNSYKATVTIKNTGKKVIRNWFLEIYSQDEIESVWDAQLQKTIIDNQYYISCNNYNKDIGVNESITFSFIAKYNEFEKLFNNVYMYQEEQIIPEENFYVETEAVSAWDNEQILELKIYNNGTNDIVDWSLSMNTTSEIESVWGAELVEQENGLCVLSYSQGNDIIKGNDSVTIRLQTKNHVEESAACKNVKLMAWNWDKETILKNAEMEMEDEEIVMEVGEEKLSEREYENLSRAFTKDEITNMSPEMLDLLKDDESLHIEATETKYIRTDYLCDLGGDVISETSTEIPEEQVQLEMKKINKARGAIHTTTMKKLTIEVKTGASISQKNVIIHNTWLDNKIPKVLSFDVIALRPETFSVTANTYSASTISAYQKYDTNKYHRYSYGNKNIIINGSLSAGKGGIGVSMNLDDKAKMMENELMVTFYSGKDPFIVYGTYQHATKNVTLKQSQSYKFSKDGYGGVLDFNKSVRDYYDKMQGVDVKWSMSGV